MFTTPSAVPTAAVVSPSFQIMNTTNNHHTLVSSSTTPNPSWRLTTTPTQPSVVSIINGNSSTLYITTQPTTTANIIRQSPQTVRLVSPSFTLINNSNTTITGQTPVISSSNNNNIQSGICIDKSVLGRLATSTTLREENSEEQVENIENFL
jgi:hypothetical protein